MYGLSGRPQLALLPGPLSGTIGSNGLGSVGQTYVFTSAVRTGFVTANCVIGSTLTGPDSSSDRCVSTSNHFNESIVSPNNSTRTGLAVFGGNRSRMPPRNANSPASPTRSVRTNPFSTIRSKSSRISSSSPSANLTTRDANSSGLGNRENNARAGTISISTLRSISIPSARISFRTTPNDGDKS